MRNPGIVDSTSVRVFAGYQFESEHYARSDLENAISRACEMASDDLARLQAVSIQYTPPVIPVGEFLLPELKARIESSDLCVFEVSDVNANVFYELGIAHTLRKPTILLVSATAPRDPALPSDLQGLVYLRYTDMEQLSTKLPSEILRLSRAHLRSDSSLESYLHHLWMAGSPGETILVGEDIVSVREGAGRKDVYYIHSGDAIALNEAQVNYTFVNRSRNVTKVSSKGFKGSDIGKNLIAIGGPRSNSITKRLLDRMGLPWSFHLDPECNPDGKEIRHASRDCVCRATRNDRVSEDYCMVVGGPNPFSAQKRILIFAGLHTFGVLAGLRAISPAASGTEVRSNMQMLVQQGWMPGQTFQIVAPATVYNLDPVTPTFVSSKIEVVTSE